MLLFDADKDLNRQLRRLPQLWLDPVSRYTRWETTPSNGVEGSMVGRRRNGSIERVRYAFGPGKALLWAEYQALQTTSHENLVQLRWVGMYTRRLYVATSWVDVDERKVWPIPIRTLLSQMECAARGVAALH